MEPFNFETAFAYFTDYPQEVVTLGNESKIIVSVSDQYLKITTQNKSEGLINKNHWNMVMMRAMELNPDEREMTSRYSHGPNDYN